MSTKNGRLAVLVMSIVCAFCLTAGILTFNGAVPTAKADAVALYSNDFEGVSGNADGDGIFQGTGLAGGNRSIVSATDDYIEAIYSFYDNGCQIGNVYQDTNRGVAFTDTAKTYTVHMVYRHFGYIKDSTIGLQGASADYNSVLIVYANGDVVVSNYGAQKYVSLVSATAIGEGWYDIVFDFQGTGSYFQPIFWMNSSDYEKANAEANTGFDLAEFKVTCGEETIYDLNVTAGLEGNDAIFGASGFATGHSGAFLTKAGSQGITGKTLKVTYNFWEDGGWQNNNLYSDTGRIDVTLEVDKQYVVEFDTKLIGSADQNYLIALQLDPNNGWAKMSEAQAILKADGSYEFVDTSAWGGVPNASLNSDLSSITVENGVFHVKLAINGLGYKFQLIGNMHCTDPVGANANNDTGMLFDNFKIYEYQAGGNTPDTPVVPGESEVDEEYDVVYSENFNNVPASTSGGDAMYQACGFAGALRSLTIDSEGLNGTKAIKVIYDFWEDGGWQKESFYSDTGRVNVTLEEGKEYVIEFKAKSLGSVFQNIFIFRQLDANNNWAIMGETQAIMKADGTLDFAEYSGSTLNREKSSYTVDENGVYTVKMVVTGLGYRLQMLGNMCSSDPATSNANGDTGFLLDDFMVKVKKDVQEEPEIDLSGEYRVSFVQTFESIDVTTSGSDAMYHASGFAGISNLTIETANPINGSKSLKAVYAFWEDGGWQNGNAYLDSSRTSNTVQTSIYRISMKVKPFGHWSKLAIGLSYNNDSCKEVIYVNSDGTHSAETIYNSIIIKYEITEENGVYSVDIYTYGTGAYIFNYFHMLATDATLANQEETGFYLDDYSFAKQLKAEGAGLNKKAHYHNKYVGGNFVTAGTFSEIESITIGETALTTEQYSYENGILTVYESVLNALANGSYTLTAVCGADVAEVALEVANVAMGNVYEMDFAGMPNLNGGQEGNDNFYFNSYMDPGRFDIYTVDEGDNRMVKFVKGEISEAFTQLFQFNPQPGRLNCLTKDKWHSVSADIKVENVSIIGVEIRVHDGADPTAYYMELDLVAGKRIDDGAHSPYASWRIVDKGNGWYNLTVEFIYTGDNYSDTAAAYLMYNGIQSSENSAYYFDNLVVQSELVPSLVSGKNSYDVASSVMPYSIVDLCRVFDIAEIKAGEQVLAVGSDYTTETTPLGYVRINFAKGIFEGMTLGEIKVIEILTSKGNVINVEITAVDTTPSLPAEVIADIAEEKAVSAEIDLKGYEIAQVKVGETVLIGTEYNYNGALGVMEFKHAYLKTLTVGEYVYEITTTSDAKGTFKLIVKDSTPVISDVVYEKSEGGALVVDVDLMGKELTSVAIGNFTLMADEYSYENGKLTINEQTISGLNAGEHALTVTTITSVTVKLTVKDAPPVFSGEYVATVGSDLVIDVEIYGKDIISVTVDGLELYAEEYAYAEGKLTVKGSVFEELALGEREIVLVTAGGESRLTFTLQAKAEEGNKDSTTTSSGCVSSLASTSLLSVLAFAVAFLFKKKR